MSIRWPRSTLARLVVAVMLAALACVFLVWRAQNDSPAGERGGTAPELPGRTAASLAVTSAILGNARHIDVALHQGQIAQRAAPVLEILREGGVRILVASPRPNGPLPEPYERAGIVLPARLDALGPAERVALLDTLGALAHGRVLGEIELGVDPASGTQAELLQLLHWQR